jgi:uncharacterized membrane protein YhaH (DUF805 family)
MTAIAALAGFSGRIGRAHWWLGLLFLMLVSAAAIGLAALANAPLLALPLFLLVTVSFYALSVKRLHDRGMSGWWALAFFFIPGVLDRITDRLTEGTPLWWVLVLTGSALSIWGLIELGFRRGTDGRNEYGPDPLAQRGRLVETRAAGC